jgi:transcription initiation factor IIE alpha subunit
MSFEELLKKGSMNEIANELIERRCYAVQDVRDALIEFFERGAASAQRKTHDTPLQHYVN